MPPQREQQQQQPLSLSAPPGENPKSVPSKADLVPSEKSQTQSSSVDNKTSWSKNILGQLTSSSSISNASDNQTARAARRYKIPQNDRVGAVISSNEDDGFGHKSDALIFGKEQDIDCTLKNPKILGALIISTLLLTFILLFILKWLNWIEVFPKRGKGGTNHNIKFQPDHGLKHSYPGDCEASVLAPIQESICPESSVRIDNMNGSGLTTNSKYIIHPPRDRVRKLSHVGKFPISTEKLQSYISPLWDNGPRKRSLENMRPQNAPAPPSGSFV